MFFQILYRNTGICVTEVNFVIPITFLVLVDLIVKNILGLESFTYVF